MIGLASPQRGLSLRQKPPSRRSEMPLSASYCAQLWLRPRESVMTGWPQRLKALAIMW